MELDCLSSTPVVLGRVIVYGRDPSGYFAFAIAVVGTQALVWGIARHSADIEWWRSLAIGVIGIVSGALAMGLFGSDSGAGQVAGALLAGSLVTWIIAGFLYDLEHWQRAVLSLAAPLIGGLAMVGGIAIRNALYEYILK